MNLIAAENKIDLLFLFWVRQPEKNTGEQLKPRDFG